MRQVRSHGHAHKLSPNPLPVASQRRSRPAEKCNSSRNLRNRILDPTAPITYQGQAEDREAILQRDLYSSNPSRLSHKENASSPTDTCITWTIIKIVGAASCVPRHRMSLGRKQTLCALWPGETHNNRLPPPLNTTSLEHDAFPTTRASRPATRLSYRPCIHTTKQSNAQQTSACAHPKKWPE